jgi:mono/diheme cytochrome c family protein
MPRRTETDIALEALVWVLFAALLVPAGFVGYLIGRHDAEGGTKTVTSAAATPATTTATTTQTGGGGTSTEAATTAQTTTSSQGTSNLALGQQLFADNCSVCHGATGQGGNGGPDLTAIPSAKSLQRVIAQVTNGGGAMPPFKGQLTEQQIRAVATYVTQRITNK